MADLDNILAEARETNDKMQAALGATDESTMRQIVRLRTRFATLVAEMMSAIRTDPRLAANPELKDQFDAKFAEMRQELAKHQHKWRSTEIESDEAGYRMAGREMGHKQDAFYRWAQDALRDA
ncbi:hypothetical protein OZN62_07855 [Aurantiacibacter sp. MUD11]|uniref:hypothetical protein n=1 Tax=Aurantiacibacter sp. MUD11 TaxID=3003265 RepID=UPI0022AB3276|nr:hypothetical protein [Aurantiacibacter sp. MUD11]WAT16859.1 hypothetical protein OZN62_07855 [Aurantiacibacter sp. MUD11]